MKFRITVNFTNLVGALLLGRAMFIGVDTVNAVIWPCVIMILGRAVIPELVNVIDAMSKLKNKGAEQQ